MKTVCLNNGNYFVDEFPQGKTEYQFAVEEVKLFNFKYCDEDTLAFCSWFRNFKQPDRTTVKRAMIWKYEDYGIKSGGGSLSDNVWSATLSTTIDNNGIDRDVVLIKKWSTKFENVLITFEELESLYLSCEKPSIKKRREEQDACCLVKHYLRNCLFNNSEESEKSRRVLLKYNNLLAILPKFIDKCIKDRDDIINRKSVFLSLNSEQQWKENLNNIQKRLNLLRKIKQDYETT